MRQRSLENRYGSISISQADMLAHMNDGAANIDLTQAAVLPRIAADVRALSLAMIYRAQSGHPGSSLSCADLLTYIWLEEFNPEEIFKSRENRPTLVLSKGHAVPALYALAFYSQLIDETDILGFRKFGGRLQGHPDVRTLSWLDGNTGSLGQGFSVAIGQALGKKMTGSDFSTFVLLGDGELQEGQVWEGAMFARHHGLTGLVAVVDRNLLQSDSSTEKVMALEPLAEKWTSFGWHVQEIDGHNYEQIASAIQIAKSVGAPSVIIAKTVKGKGVSYMEGIPAWHGSVAMKADEIRRALSELQPTSGYVDFVLSDIEGSFNV